MTRRTAAAAAAALAATTVFAAAGSSAQAAPGWMNEEYLHTGWNKWGPSELGFAQDGLQIGARTDFNSTSPLDLTLGVATRRPGSVFADAFTIPTAASIPIGVKLAVAPNGAAVLGWVEFDSSYPAGPAAFLTRYRTPAGAWQPPVQIALDATVDAVVIKGVTVAIGDDGTAVAGAVHLEPDGPGEAETDARADVLVHPPGGGWGTGTRLSAPNRSVLELYLGVDAAGNATAAWLERFDESDPVLGSRNTVIAKHRPTASGAWVNDGSVAGIGTGESATAMSFDVAPSGRAVIAYGFDSSSDTDTFVTRRDAASAQFGPPVRAVPDPGTVGSEPIGAGIAPNGTYYVVIHKPNPAQFLVARTPGAGQFFSPKPIFAGAGTPRDAKLAFDGNDAFIAADTASADPVLRVTRWRSGAADPDPSSALDANQPVDLLTQLISDRDGSIVAVWATKDYHARMAVYDGGPPRLVAADVPSSGAPDAVLTFRATFADAWSPAATTWDFGDGTTATGDTVTHAYSAAGAFAVTARGADTLGNERTKAFAVTIAVPAAGSRDTIKPKVTLALPKCKPHSSAKTCKRLRRSRSAWKTLHGKASDAAPSSGIARIEVSAAKRGGKAVRRTVTVSSGTWALTLPRLAEGRWTFSVRAVDRSGNVSRPAKRMARLR